MKRNLLGKLSLVALGFSLLVGCGSNVSTAGADNTQEKKTIKFGTCPGPYADMVKYALKPSLEAKGYTIEVIEFSDYVQPNLALSKGEIDANLFQHEVYFENFKTEHNLELTKLINVPTAGLGIYSNKYKELSEVEEGATLTVPNDVTNLRRALKEAQNAGLLTIDETVDATAFSEKDITSNPLNLAVTGVEAAQLPRTLDSADLAAVPGNFALAAGMDLSSAIYTETLAEEMKNIIAVQTKDKDAQFVKDIIDVVESEDFKNVIEGSDYDFSAFQKPEWYTAKWGNKAQ